MLLAPGRGRPVFGQAVNPAPPPGASVPGAEKQKADVGSYSLVVTDLEPSQETHLLTPPLAIAINGGTVREPGDFAGEKAVPAQFAIDDFAIPRYDCVPTVPKLHGCDALERTGLTILNPATVGYHIVSHGAAVTLNVNLEVHDLLPVSRGSGEMPWHAGEVIFVALPKASATYLFVSETLVGTWNNDPVVFEVGKVLPNEAKNALDDLGVKQDLGDHVLYSFRVRDPKAKDPGK